MKPVLCLAAGLCFLLISFAHAQEAAPIVPVPDGAAQAGPVVVELFTSQGCPSCPPADAMLAELVGREDVLPLALHVDYWDYLGWVDAFARPHHTERQKAYARMEGSSMIYTPQIVVDGQHVIAGARPMKLAERIMIERSRPVGMVLNAERTGHKLRLRAHVLRRLPEGGALLVQLVRYAPLRRVEITGGENAGHHIDYVNVVEEWETLERWDGQAPLDLSTDLPGEAAAAVLIQREGPGPIIAAARVR